MSLLISLKASIFLFLFHHLKTEQYIEISSYYYASLTLIRGIKRSKSKNNNTGKYTVPGNIARKDFYNFCEGNVS